MKLNLTILIFFIGIYNCLYAQDFNGTWEETYWSPMASYYSFNSKDSTFKYYYHNDTEGSYGKGRYCIKRNKIILDFDSIICDEPKIELLNNNLIHDSTYIEFFHYWGFQKRIDLLYQGERIYSKWTNSISDSIIEDYLFIKIPQRIDSIDFAIYDSHGSKDTLVTRFSVKLHKKAFCVIYYYPCNSWYSYEKKALHELKYKWINNDFFEIIGKYKYGFKRKIK